MSSAPTKTSLRPLPKKAWTLPVLTSVALMAGALAERATVVSTEPAMTALWVLIAGLCGWRVAEVFLHRARDRRLQRVANHAIENAPELADQPVKVALVLGSVAAFWEWTGWYRNYHFAAMIYPSHGETVALQGPDSDELGARLAPILLAALQENGWIQRTDERTLVILYRPRPNDPISATHLSSRPAKPPRPADAGVHS